MVSGPYKPSIEFSMHLGIYKERPEVNCIVHTHSKFATAVSAMDLSLIHIYCVTPAISICLLSMNMRELKKLNREPVIALVSAIFSVCFIAIILGLFFAPRITEGWKCAGMFVGTYTGGTPNLTAIATGLDCSRAVSYTHLDVYKRQGGACEAP